VRALFDVNALIALLDEQHLHSGRAHSWWLQNQGNGWASCPLTQNGFVRVIAQPTYPSPISIGQAFSLLRRNTETAGHAFWPDDISLFDDQLVDRSRVLGPKQVTDVYLLALAVKHGGRLVTFDRAIPRDSVRGASAHHLVTL
jgi:uncharacterized protein